jgi:very-short-patch-repair endonuclease
MSSNNQLDRFCESARKDLLDLSLRNRLINLNLTTKRSSSLRILSNPLLVFETLVREGKPLSFVPTLGSGAGGDIAGGDDVHDLPDESSSVLSSSGQDLTLDEKLRARLTKEQLESKLLKLYYDARTAEEEQGVSILYLVLGVVKWFEDEKSEKARHAPLILIPVDLERASVKAGFKLKFRDEEITSNLSLQAKLKQDFGVALPDIPETETWSPVDYFNEVSKAIAHQRRWEVIPQFQILWMFSFAKYLMYRDLGPENWPEDNQLGSNQNIQRLIDSSVPHAPPLCTDEDKLDALIQPREMFHVTEADGSQAVVIEEVRRGRSLVVQGPPGTGKSQTISNIIATAVKDGKRVLFVAEKMAALEVVKSRLQRFGLAAICLELHSHKANKKSVLSELKQTLDLGRPKVADVNHYIERLVNARDRLNQYADALNQPIASSGLSPYDIIGKLCNQHEDEAEICDFSLPGAETWNEGQFQSMRSVVKQFLPALEKVHPINRHPWRGVRITANLLPAQRAARLKETRQVLDALDELSRLALGLTQAFGGSELPTDVSIHGIGRMVRKAKYLATVPPCDRRSLGHDVWDQQLPTLKQLVAEGSKLATAKFALQKQVTDAAWDLDLTQVRPIWVQRGRSWLRWFSSEFRQAKATLASVMTSSIPATYAEQLGVIDKLIFVRRQSQKISEKLDSLGAAAFGTNWQGVDSNWEQLKVIVDWVGTGVDQKYGDLRKRVSKSQHNQDTSGPTKTLEDFFAQWESRDRLTKLFNQFDLETSDVFETENNEQVPVRAIHEFLSCWIESSEGLSDWISYKALRTNFQSHNLDDFASRLDSGEINSVHAIARFEQKYYEILWEISQRERKPLQAFSGQSHQQLVHEFRELDRQRIELARQEVLKSHFDGIPRTSVAGEMAVIHREINKKSRFLPIRKLMQEAGRAIQQIKPVFLMSPMSVAQYLPAGRIEFDLLIIDEASQVTPADALGALARARQAVVVGDEQQLPPTSFFSRISGNEDEEQEEDTANASTQDLESVLGLCQSRGWPRRMLQWHYRSRHDSLIAVSNQEFYDNRLFVVPSPAARQDQLGLQFRHLPKAAYDRGKSRTNREEARHIAIAVMEHARHCGEKSLGIGTFSMAQRDAVLNEIELLRKDNPDIEQFFQPTESDSTYLEPFFVKNLENIQGDERDVIFISVGYGRDSNGYMTMSFGPLNGEGGHRRMNVMISRARERCVVFSALSHDDIDLERTKARGSAVLKTFLRFAQTGILDSSKPSGGECDSEFEEQVKRAIENHGFKVHSQVGTAGFKVDLGVVDPRQPGRYVLGIECDGATYHSARWARERDRMRQAVLEDHGWRIHRIWSTDWFQRPREQVDVVLQAIRQAIDEVEVPSSLAIESGTSDTDSLQIEREDEETAGEVQNSWVVPYQEAMFFDHGVSSFDKASQDQLATIVVRIVDVEGPVFHLEVVRRLATLCGHQRLSARLGNIASESVNLAVRQRRVQFEDGFMSRSNPGQISVRDRSNVSSGDLRKPEYLPPSELKRAVQEVISRNIGPSRLQLHRMLSQAIGLGSTSQNLRNLFDRIVDDQIACKQIAEQEGRLYETEKQ